LNNNPTTLEFIVVGILLVSCVASIATYFLNRFDKIEVNTAKQPSC